MSDSVRLLSEEVSWDKEGQSVRQACIQEASYTPKIEWYSEIIDPM